MSGRDSAGGGPETCPASAPAKDAVFLGRRINVCSKDMPGREEFYRDALDLQLELSLDKGRILDKDGYPGKVAFLSDGNNGVVPLSCFVPNN